MYRTCRKSAVTVLCALTVFLYMTSAFAQTDTTPQPGRIAAVVSGGDAFLPGATEMVAAARAEVIPNPSGRYALLIRRDEAPPPGPATGQDFTGGAAILLYDAVARRTRLLWEQADAHGTRHAEISSAAWFPGTDTLVAVVETMVLDAPAPEGREPVTTVLFADATRDVRARPISVISNTTRSLSVSVSPTKPVAAIITNSPLSAVEAERSVQIGFLDAKGRLGTPIELRGLAFANNWLDNGANVYVTQFPPRSDDGVRQRRYLKLAPETGQFTELPQRPKPEDLTRDLPLLKTAVRAFSGTGNATLPAAGKAELGTKAIGLKSLWLAPASDAGTPPLFLAPQAQEAWVLSDNSAVLFTAQNAAYAVPLVRLSLARLEAVQRAAWKHTALQNAKQIGLALMGYAMDNNETFPATEGYRGVLQDYVKNDAIFNNPATGMPGFTYVMTQMSLSKIAAVAETPLGYLTGPDGRAVLYADGHVKWEDPPPTGK